MALLCLLFFCCRPRSRSKRRKSSIQRATDSVTTHTSCCADGTFSSICVESTSVVSIDAQQSSRLDLLYALEQSAAGKLSDDELFARLRAPGVNKDGSGDALQPLPQFCAELPVLELRAKPVPGAVAPGKCVAAVRGTPSNADGNLTRIRLEKQLEVKKWRPQNPPRTPLPQGRVVGRRSVDSPLNQSPQIHPPKSPIDDDDGECTLM